MLSLLRKTVSHLPLQQQANRDVRAAKHYHKTRLAKHSLKTYPTAFTESVTDLDSADPLLPCADQDARRTKIQTDVDNLRTIILHNADSKKDHIPPIKASSPGALTYPFDIVPECAHYSPSCHS